MKLLHALARASAVLAGVVLTLITLMTCASLIGRNTLGVSLVGDFELTGVAAGAAVALFMPWCQVRRGHIIVDFFTARLAPATNAQLDRLGVIELRPLNRYRLRVDKLFRWRPDGPVMDYFRREVVPDYYAGGFDGEAELLVDLLPSPMFDPLDGGVFTSRRGTSWALPNFTRDCLSQARAAVALFNAYRATGEIKAEAIAERTPNLRAS